LQKFRQLTIIDRIRLKPELAEILITDGITTASMEGQRFGEHPQRLRFRLAIRGNPTLNVTGGDSAIIFVDELNALFPPIRRINAHARTSEAPDASPVAVSPGNQ
jgi:hypothetical protein